MAEEKNYRLTLAYDGTRYCGWQRQGNTENTLQTKLETLLTRLLRQSVELHASGRTDAGVHARRQVCSFRAATAMPTGKMAAEITRFLPEDIALVGLEEADARFHARLSCRRKTYLYRLWVSGETELFERRYVVRAPENLDMARMREAARLLEGRHDFSAFTVSRTKKSRVREVEEIRFERTADELRLFFTGNGFLQQMVRILTGTLLEVGQGVREPGQMGALLAEGRRADAGPAAPARGLTLWDVEY